MEFKSKDLVLDDDSKVSMYNLYKSSYDKIGLLNIKGIDHTNISNEDKIKFINYLLEYYNYITTFSDDNDKGYILWWGNKYGKKIGLVFGDRNIVKEKIIPFLLSKLQEPGSGYYGEFSDALLHIMKKNSKTPLIPIKDKDNVCKLIYGDIDCPIKTIHEDGSYEREIGDKPHIKQMLGSPLTMFGIRKSNKRKSNKRKSNKRKSNKRKSNKRKSNKRKSNKRKSKSRYTRMNSNSLLF